MTAEEKRNYMWENICPYCTENNCPWYDTNPEKCEI